MNYSTIYYKIGHVKQAGISQGRLFKTDKRDLLKSLGIAYTVHAASVPRTAI
jgi:hypothetical protein